MLSVYAFRMSMAAFFCPGVSWLSFLLSSSSATWDADGTESRISTSADSFVRKGKVSYAGGKYKNGAVTLSTRTLGDFCVVADTVPPRIEPRFKAGEPIRTRSITFRLRDNFSGIGSYTATLDGEWILLERNPMQGTITHTFDDSRTPKGRSYTLQLTVTDNCGNKTVWKRTITR